MSQKDALRNRLQGDEIIAGCKKYGMPTAGVRFVRAEHRAPG
jgi:hypothetical protein